MDVIHLVQDRDQWRALVNTVMNNKILINPWVAAQLAASREGFSSMGLVTRFWDAMPSSLVPAICCLHV
jgi:hypothetical protein